MQNKCFVFCVSCLVIDYVFICLIILILTGQVSVQEEVGSKFCRVGAGAVQAKTIRLRVKEREPAAVIVSKSFIACGNLLEYMFVSLLGDVLQTVIDTLAAEYTAYSPNNFCLLKGLFIVYFMMIEYLI